MLTLTAPAHSALRVVGLLEPMPAILGQKWATPWTNRQFMAGPTHRDKQGAQQTHKYLRKSNNRNGKKAEPEQMQTIFKNVILRRPSNLIC